MPPRRRPRDLASNLPHWSEVPDERRRARPPLDIAAGLADLVNWVADVAVKVTRPTTTEDQDAIERVRSYALKWLAGESSPDTSMQDLLTTTAAIMAAIDRKLLDEEDAAEHDELPVEISLVWIA